MPDLNYFCVENIANVANNIKFQSTGTFTLPTLEYSVDDGSTWANYIIDSDIILGANSKCYFRGNNNTFNVDYYNYIKLITSTNINLSGNIMSLLDKTCESLVIPVTYCFVYLFNSTNVVDASNLLLPATTLTANCYSYMFGNCSLLVYPPNLPAMTLAKDCYSFMFGRCTSLTQLPALPAKALNIECYLDMFSYCTQIKFSNYITSECKNRYRLPITGFVTQSGYACLSSMFYKITSSGSISMHQDYYTNMTVSPAYIDYQINNLLYTTTANIVEPGLTDITINLSPIEYFSLPETITVNGADYTYDNQTGEIILTNLTNNISVIANGVEHLLTPKISLDGDLLTVEQIYRADDYEINFEEVN